MKKIVLLFFIAFLFIGNSYSQEKELSLEDAVLRQYSNFYPSGISGLQWIKNKNSVCWISEDASALVQWPGTGGETADTLLKLDQLNEALGLELKRMPSPSWNDANSFYFSDRKFYYTYDLNSGQGEQWLEIAKGQNRSFNKGAEAFAFTKKNNLYLQEKGQEPVAITKFEDPEIIAGQAIARHEFGIGKGIFWSPKGKHIAFYQKDESEVSDYPILDITTTPGSLVNVKYPMAGQGSEKASVGVYNLETKSTTYLKTDGPKDQYLTNLGWGPEEKYIYIAVLNRAQNHMKLNKYDAVNGDLIKTLFEEKHDKYVEPEQAVQFIPGRNNEFIWFSERDGFNHIYRYNTDGDLLMQVTKGKRESQEIICYDENSQHVFYMGTDKSGLNRLLYKAALDKVYVETLTSVPGMHYFDASSNGKYFIDQYSHANMPRKIQVIDSNGKVVKDMHTAENPLKDHKLASAKFVEIEAEDGTKLNGRLIKPYDFDPEKKYPVLVYVYGGPHAQMVTNRWLLGAPLWMYWFADQGYLVFTLDNRGSGNRGFDFENVIHRQLGEVEIKDQLAGVEYLKSLGYADLDRMAMHGWSYGGFMTTSMMLKTPGVFQVGVAGGPVTDWKYYEIMYGERYMDTPEENPEGYELTSLLNKADKLEGDLLLIHGTSDDVVVMQHNLSLIQEFVKAGKQVDFFPYPMHKHNVRGKDRLHLMEKILNYVDEKLGGK